MKHLEKKGWRIDRKRGEPVWFQDPLDFESRWMRVEEAYDLQRRRENSGLA